jgi:hypothetical protein
MSHRRGSICLLPVVSLLVITLSTSTSASVTTIARASVRLAAANLAWTAIACLESGRRPVLSGAGLRVDCSRDDEVLGMPAGLTLVRVAVSASTNQEVLVYEVYLPAARVHSALDGS